MATISRASLEDNQVALYFAAVVAGLLATVAVPSNAWGAAVTPALGGLIYMTFLQVPLGELRQSLANGRFLLALLVVNFVVVPCVASALVSFLPGDQWAVRLGALLVLLAPCIDYVVVFTHLGRGDAKLVLAATPVLLLVQMLLLPVYFGLLIGAEATVLMRPGPFLEAFVWLIAVPLFMAGATQAWAAHAVALVVPVYIAFALVMPYVGRAIARLFGLETEAAKAVVFSGSTRNSLVVLPLAFAVPDAGALVPAVVVTQTLVELVAMLVYVRWVPRLVRTAAPATG